MHVPKVIIEYYFPQKEKPTPLLRITGSGLNTTLITKKHSYNYGLAGAINTSFITCTIPLAALMEATISDPFT